MFGQFRREPLRAVPREIDSGFAHYFNHHGMDGISRLGAGGSCARRCGIGDLVEKGWGANVLKLCGATLLGAAILYIPGLIWLVGWLIVMMGMDAASAVNVALTTGLLPFIPGDIIKAILAALAFPAAFSLMGRR